MKIQIAIATGQVMANLLPVLAEIPDKLILLVSDDMRVKAEAFIRQLKAHPKLQSMVIEQIPGLPDTPLAAIQDFGFTLLEQLEATKTPDVTFNLSGGTKLMTLALAQVLQEDYIRHIYPNTIHNQLEILWPEKQNPQILPSVLDAKTYLQAHGVTWRKADSDQDNWQEKVQQRKTLTFLLATQLAKATDNTQNLIRQLNAAGANAVNSNNDVITPKQQLSYTHANIHHLLAKYAEYELLDWAPEQPKEVIFRSKDALRYITGGWLEEYFYLVAQQAGLTDSHCGIKITDNISNKADIRNELDGAAVENNRLLLVECKTAKLGKDTQKDANIIYKLDSLAKHIGGLFYSPLLLSALPVDHTTKNHREVNITERARSVDITLLDGAKIIKLKDLLLHWKQHGNLHLKI